MVKTKYIQDFWQYYAYYFGKLLLFVAPYQAAIFYTPYFLSPEYELR